MEFIKEEQVLKMSLIELPERKRHLLTKICIRFIDILGAIVGLLALIPFWIYVAIEHIKNKDESPVFYYQKRIGKNGKIFKMYKFSSKSIISNFPQFINVLKGEMTLVGPRPYMYYEKEKMGKYYDIISKSKPGLTGVYQISGKALITFNERLDMDLKYILKRSFKKDLKIIAITLLVTPKYRTREYFNEYNSEEEMFRYKLLSIISRFVDIIISLIGVLGISLITPIVWLGNRLCKDKGPVFYTQERIGKDGQIFKMYKFRSMVVGAEEILEKYLEENEEVRKEYKINKKLKNDPRITKMGNILRKTSVDEFPQFINVLKGDMSFVGPRPYLPQEKCDIDNESYENIVKVRPGITGLWQVSGRSELTFKERIELDNDYYKKRNIKLYFKIIKLTILKVFKREGAI